jgi:hypothetical protein
MVLLTLASFVMEKFGGDTMSDVRDGLDRYLARIAAPPEAPVAGGRRSTTTDAATGPAGTATADVPAAAHGLTGTDEAGSGGDD